MTYDDIAIFVVVLLALAGGINVIGGAAKHLKTLVSPVTNANERLDAVESHLDNDNKRLMMLEESNKLLLRSMYALLEHEANGGDSLKLEELQADIHDYLINR